MLTCTVAPGSEVPSAAETDAWRTLANYRPDFALPQFEQLSARDGTDASAARFGVALSLLARPSPVPDRLLKARGILTALAADGTDDLALGARFYLARLAELQSAPPDYEQAAEIFRRLIAEHEPSAWAQAALPRLAILLLYTSAGPAAPADRVTTAESLLGSAQRTLTMTELHLVIADAIFHHRLPDRRALPHLLAAERLGGMDAATRADVLVQIGKLSRLAGQPAQAARYYETFLTEYPRDSRQHAIRQELAAVTGPKTAR